MRALTPLLLTALSCGATHGSENLNAPDVAALGGTPAASGSRIQARFALGEDGSRIPFGYFDTKRGENCSPLATAGGILRCLPISTGAFFAGYADSACKSPLFFSTTVGCPPKYGLETIVDSDQACSVSRNRLNQITGAASPSMVYTKTSTSCNGAAPVASWSYWTATPIADSESVAFSLRSL